MPLYFQVSGDYFGFVEFGGSVGFVAFVLFICRPKWHFPLSEVAFY
jgi:hypothetical protein